MAREIRLSRKASAQRKLAVLPGQIHDFRHRVFKKPGLHARGSHRADLLFIHKDTTDRTIRFFRQIQHRLQGSVGANPVVLTVSEDDASVKARFPGQRKAVERLLYRMIAADQAKGFFVHCLRIHGDSRYPGTL